MNNAISKLTFSVWLRVVLIWFYMFPQAEPFDNIIIVIGLYFFKNALDSHLG